MYFLLFNVVYVMIVQIIGRLENVVTEDTFVVTLVHFVGRRISTALNYAANHLYSARLLGHACNQ